MTQDILEFKMETGDVNSREMGTGARAHGGKARWELMPLLQVAFILESESEIVARLSDISEAEMIRTLGFFQAGKIDIDELLIDAVAYNWSIQGNIGAGPSILNLMTSLENVIRVWDYGLRKYSEFNWATGMDWSIPIACAVRHVRDHFNAFDQDSESMHYDAESKELHSAHVVCNVMMLAHYVIYWTAGDDRPLFAFPKTSEGSEATESPE